MTQDTRERKHATTVLKALRGQEWLAEHVTQILETGKESLDRFLLELGGMVAETIMLLEREELAGPDYGPKIPDVLIKSTPLYKVACCNGLPIG